MSDEFNIKKKRVCFCWVFYFLCGFMFFYFLLGVVVFLYLPAMSWLLVLVTVLESTDITIVVLVHVTCCHLRFQSSIVGINHSKFLLKLEVLTFSHH